MDNLWVQLAIPSILLIGFAHQFRNDDVMAPAARLVKSLVIAVWGFNGGVLAVTHLLA